MHAAPFKVQSSIQMCLFVHSTLYVTEQSRLLRDSTQCAHCCLKAEAKLERARQPSCSGTLSDRPGCCCGNEIKADQYPTHCFTLQSSTTHFTDVGLISLRLILTPKQVIVHEK
ncbi:hypothetical protein AMECASPLE_006282 [Ameca splendens]|uniref:Uncharacterized protein n=1 Tax=Ameca splendens TaxID=208324 RepID=A0ABV0Z8F7_9TELE